MGVFTNVRLAGGGVVIAFGKAFGFFKKRIVGVQATIFGVFQAFRKLPGFVGCFLFEFSAGFLGFVKELFEGAGAFFFALFLGFFGCFLCFVQDMALTL